MVKVKTTLERSDYFQVVRSGEEPKVRRKIAGTATSKRFQVLEDELDDEPRFTLVGNS